MFKHFYTLQLRSATVVDTVCLCVLVHYFRKEGHKPYSIPVGGSSTVGAWGYIDGFREMIEQVRVVVKKKFFFVC